MATDLHAVLQELTASPSTEHPFLSIYLNWVPDGNGKRPAVRILEDELATISERLAGDTADREGFEADRRRIIDYVHREAPKDARGLAIFACHAQGVWTALPLQAPV